LLHHNGDESHLCAFSETIEDCHFPCEQGKVNRDALVSLLLCTLTEPNMLDVQQEFIKLLTSYAFFSRDEQYNYLYNKGEKEQLQFVKEKLKESFSDSENVSKKYVDLCHGIVIFLTYGDRPFQRLPFQSLNGTCD
tara:strand:+ start:197 stop:604 length:408 start_codon:yes stop_codon:yes gene_type:complete